MALRKARSGWRSNGFEWSPSPFRSETALPRPYAGSPHVQVDVREKVTSKWSSPSRFRLLLEAFTAFSAHFDPKNPLQLAWSYRQHLSSLPERLRRLDAMCLVSEERAQSALRAVSQFASVAGQVQHQELRSASLQVAHEALAQCEAHSQRCVAFLLTALQKSSGANAHAVEDVIWMVYKVAQRSDTAKVGLGDIIYNVSHIYI